MKKHLEYWRASLIDSTKKTPSDSSLMSAIQVQCADIKRGKANEARQLLPTPSDGSKPKPISVCVVAKWATAKVMHGERKRTGERNIYPLIMFYANLNDQGELFIDKDCGEPFIPREFIAPNDGVNFIDMDCLDRFYQRQVSPMSSCNDMMAFVDDLYGELSIDESQVVSDTEDKCWILADEKNSSAVDAIIKLYDGLLLNPPKQTTALNELIVEVTDQLSPPDIKDERLNNLHVGQMGGEHGLSTSQRMSLLTFIEDAGRVLAVNGAPGTGKTTLLQSIVATVWTQAAIDRRQCPLIVGASTNNQAVENITDAFFKAGLNKNDPCSVALSGRWIEGVFAYGMNMPSSTARAMLGKNGKAASMQLYIKHPSSKDLADHFASPIESVSGLSDATDEFLGNFNACIDKFAWKKLTSATSLLAAQGLLHAELLSQVDETNEILATAREMTINERISVQNKIECAESLKNEIRAADAALKSYKATAIENAEILLAAIALRLDAILMQAKSRRIALERINTAYKAFLVFQSDEPALLSALSVVGINSKRMMRNKLFLADLDYDWPDGVVPSAENIESWFAGLKKSHSSNDKAHLTEELTTAQLSFGSLVNAAKGATTQNDLIAYLAAIDASHKKLIQLLKDNHPPVPSMSFSRDIAGIQSLLKEVSEKKSVCAEIERAIRKWQETGMPNECDMTDVLAIIDKTCRHRAFLLATHYWEACFLIETEKVVNRTTVESKDPAKLEAHFRRLAMLCPCFVSSMHSLPGWFSGYKSGVGETPLVGAIDLLIVDESGQVAPEICAASFALAKRAILVGDTKQIEPVWGVSDRVDLLNAKRYKMINSDDDYEHLMLRGKASASGSAMRIAQVASRYASHPEFSGGVFLTQHRRCLKQIIAYCNNLVYKGLLEPLTNETNRPKLDREEIPVMGYAHIRGFESQMSGSKKNDIEAETIAKWIGEKKEMILSKYGAQKLGAHLAIVTPFAAQSIVIEARLKDIGLGGDGITVGTVHKLQGAERDIVIFSPVSTDGGLAFWDKSPNLLNVAVSRAKDHFLVFGNMDYFGTIANSPSNLLMSMLKDQVHGVPIVLPNGINPTALLSNLEDHRAHLIDSIRAAKSKIVIVSPYIRENAVGADNIAAEIRAAVSSGVEVLIVVDRQQNKSDPDEFERVVASVRQAGAIVFVINKKVSCIHSKLLWVDDKLFTIGSFNWLSASRDGKFKQIEHSTVIRGEACIEMIEEAKTSIQKEYKQSRP